MPEIPAQVTEIKRILETISELDIEKTFVQTGDLGNKGDFSDSRELFNEVLSYARSSMVFQWERMPTVALRESHKYLGRTDQALQAIARLKDVGPVESPRKVSLVETLEANFNALKQCSTPFFPYVDDAPFDSALLRRDWEQAVVEGRKALATEAAEMAKMREEWGKSLDNVRSETSGHGAEKEAEAFGKAADGYEEDSQTWLIRGIRSAVVTIFAASILLFVVPIESSGSSVAVLASILGRATIIGVLVYGTVLCARLYRSNAHLTVVNRHRQKALETFWAFTEGSGTPETRDKVLLAATQAAFGQTATGLIGERGDGSSTIGIIQEIAGSTKGQ